MTDQQPRREIPVHAVIGGLPAGVILRHLDQAQINAVRRTWQMQGLDSYIRALDDALDQLKAAHASYNRRSNIWMVSLPIERSRDERAISDPITTQEAATLLGCTDRNIRALASREVLLGRQQGRTWVLSQANVLAYRDVRSQAAEAA